MVMFQAVNILSGSKAFWDGRCGPQIQECWGYEHPRKDAVLDSRGKLFAIELLNLMDTFIRSAIHK